MCSFSVTVARPYHVHTYMDIPFMLETGEAEGQEDEGKREGDSDVQRM